MSGLAHLMVAPLVALALFGGAFKALHDAAVVLPGQDLGLPYHFEPRFAIRRAQLPRAGPLDLVVIGDSRAELAVDPALLTSRAFNLSCGSLSMTLAESVLLDTLDRCAVRPRRILVAVTPDMVSRTAAHDAETERIAALYRDAEALAAGRAAPGLRLAHLAPAWVYRERIQADLQRAWLRWSGAPPPADFHGMLFTRPLTWPEYDALFAVPPVRRGYTLDVVGPLVQGGYPPSDGVRWRLAKPYAIDTAGIERLTREIRARGIEPVFTVLPFHDSFWKTHDPEIRRAVEQAVPAIRVPFDTADAASFRDGHHMSRKGAELYSRALDTALREHGHHPR